MGNGFLWLCLHDVSVFRRLQCTLMLLFIDHTVSSALGRLRPIEEFLAAWLTEHNCSIIVLSLHLSPIHCLICFPVISSSNAAYIQPGAMNILKLLSFIDVQKDLKTMLSLGYILFSSACFSFKSLRRLNSGNCSIATTLRRGAFTQLMTVLRTVAIFTWLHNFLALLVSIIQIQLSARTSYCDYLRWLSDISSYYQKLRLFARITYSPFFHRSSLYWVLRSALLTSTAKQPSW